MATEHDIEQWVNLTESLYISVQGTWREKRNNIPLKCKFRVLQTTGYTKGDHHFDQQSQLYNNWYIMCNNHVLVADKSDIAPLNIHVYKFITQENNHSRLCAETD